MYRDMCNVLHAAEIVCKGHIDDTEKKQFPPPIMTTVKVVIFARVIFRVSAIFNIFACL